MLFEPLRIGKMEIKNRIVFPPLVTNMVTEDGFLTERQIEYYAERARGGAGLVIVESSHPRVTGYPHRIMLRNERVLPGLRKLVEAIHQEGTKVVCQVNVHMGSIDVCDPASPSGIRNPNTGMIPRQLTVGDIKKLEEEFREGVTNAMELGFDGVMVHGAHGYLVMEFLSPFSNKRTDGYGGDLKGRARLAFELVEVARKAVGPDYPVMFRLTADERVEGGFRIADATIVFKWLQEAGIDAIDLTSGSSAAHEWTNPTMHLPPACNADLSEAIKKEARVPVGVTGKINDPGLAEELLRSGRADFVGIGRGLVADPYLPQKAMEGRTDDICRCITCARCGELFLKRIPMSCSINPMAGFEREFNAKLKSVPKQKKLLIVGGGPAGMEAALIAAQKGHDVTLWEKDKGLGGQLNLAHVPPDKGDITLFLDYLKGQIKKSKVKVELRKEATPAEVTAFAPDAVIIATGSTSFTPDIPGVRGENVVEHRSVLAGQKQTGHKVIVMGGGYIGCETALFLAEKRKEVTLVLRSPEPAGDVAYPDNRLPLLRKLRESGIKVEAGIKEYKEITPKGVRIINKYGKETVIGGDTIVLATGARPDNALAHALKGNVPELYEVGDCGEARRILEAVHEGARAALEV